MKTESDTLHNKRTAGTARRDGGGGSQTNGDFFRQAFAGAWMTQGISVAAELGIADLLQGKARRVEELAELTQTQVDSLYRILRALASVGVFKQEPDRRFALTPLGELLRTDAANSQRAYAIMMGMEFHATWGELLHSVQTGAQGFEKRFGMPFFAYLLKHPHRHRIYDTAMTVVHGAETEPMLDAYDFGGFRTVVDVGGGNGSMLAALLKRHPTPHGIVFDLPAVAERAQSDILRGNLQNRCHAEGGDFFAAVPPAADAYLLRHILHDWEDAEAVRILRNCREAMGREGKVLAVEMVIPSGDGPAFGKWLDLMMLLVGGRERTAEEYGALFEAAGLTLNRIIPTRAEVHILEGIRA